VSQSLQEEYLAGMRVRLRRLTWKRSTQEGALLYQPPTESIIYQYF